MNLTSSNGDLSSYWSYKPFWCQPWTIIFSGIIILIASFLIFRSLWLTIPLFLFVLIWWILFLFIAPNIDYNQEINMDIEE